MWIDEYGYAPIKFYFKNKIGSRLIRSMAYSFHPCSKSMGTEYVSIFSEF